MVTKLSQYRNCATGWTTGVQFPTGAVMVFFLLATTPRPTVGPAQPPLQCLPGYCFSGAKADQSPPPSAEVNAWSYTSTPPMRLHGVACN